MALQPGVLARQGGCQLGGGAAAFKCQGAVWEENGTLGFQKQFSSDSAIAFRCKLGLRCSSALALPFFKGDLATPCLNRKSHGNVARAAPLVARGNEPSCSAAC